MVFQMIYSLFWTIFQPAENKQLLKEAFTNGLF